MSEHLPPSRPLLAVVAATLMLAGCASDGRTDAERWMRRGYSASYRAPDEGERARLFGAFAGTLQTRDPMAWGALGYEDAAFEGSLAVREAGVPTRGWGAYAFRASDSRALLLQAPHSDSDKGTGTIALALYEHTGARALGLNSAHRTLPDSDQANAADTPFLLFTEAALRKSPDTLVLQVHGFGAATARRHGLSDATLVASNATREPDAGLLEFADCARASGIDARVFPIEAPYPGGTRNAVAGLVRRYPRARFMHLEMGAALRRSLLHDRMQLEALAACL